MRSVDTREVSGAVREICLEANFSLRGDIVSALGSCRDELAGISRDMLDIILENAAVAERDTIALCQDTGMVIVHLELGQEVRLEGEALHEAVERGVREAYLDGCLRSSIVDDAVTRRNTGTNLPACIHTDIVPGEQVVISVLIKGFGSENKSRVGMLNATSGREGIVDFCVDTVERAGCDACPPYVMGVAVGGCMDSAAFLAKKALFRDISLASEKEHLASMEEEVLEKVNALGIGVMGLGGGCTCLGVNMVSAPTHIAGLPVAVNLSCHALRTGRKVL